MDTKQAKIVMNREKGRLIEEVSPRRGMKEKLEIERLPERERERERERRGWKGEIFDIMKID